MVDFSEILCLLICFQWKKIRNPLSGFHEQRAAQTLSPSVNVITSGTEGSDFSVFAFFFYFPRAYLCQKKNRLQPSC